MKPLSTPTTLAPASIISPIILILINPSINLPKTKKKHMKATIPAEEGIVKKITTIRTRARNIDRKAKAIDIIVHLIYQ